MKVLAVGRGKVSFQHLGGGMWARGFRKDVIVPRGNGTFLIRTSRQTGLGLCFKRCSSIQMCLRLPFNKGKERSAMLDLS